MNLKELTAEIENVAKKEGLPFEEKNMSLVIAKDGLFYPAELIGVVWIREFMSFQLIFDDKG